MTLFKKNNWETWWDSLSPQMQQYLETQPIWYDSDVIKFVIIALIIGFAIGYIV